ncbi:hypothetical protein HDU91_002105 [Kappamyces sp. JEL0680]|nr:hypothetical protein HDU91_002105 [Kappamyces sp. JEL0680]
MSPAGSLLISVDVDGRALLINYQKRVLLHHHNFKEPVYDIQFSPNGRFVAVTHGNHVQIWHAPGFTREFAPFVLFKEFAGHYDTVLSLSWSPDSKYFLSTSRDMTTRLYAVNRSDFVGACLSGHNDKVLGAWFSKDCKSIFTISRDGAAYEWALQGGEWSLETADDTTVVPRKKSRSQSKEQAPVMRWKAKAKHFFLQNHAKVVSATFHAASGLLAVGFDSGIFGIWEMPDFTNIQTLSISQNKINTVAINQSGEWIAFGSSALGQLLVWEWQSESYVLKQQGHQGNMTCLDYSHDGQYIATGGDDGKVKLWNTQSGFCFVTFGEHSGAVKSLVFSRKKQVVFSASLDGTVRAFDLIRYRNFRTFTSPTPEQFGTVAVDSSGEIVVAASIENYDIYVWSVQTGQLLDILNGHEAPVSCLAFSPATGQLASGSWDKSVRIWDLFSRDSSGESIEHTGEVLALGFSPNGEMLATSTIDGNLNFWNLDSSKQVATIEGRKDIAGGRSARDAVTAANAGAGKMFNSLCFTSDGRGVLAGGNSKYVCLYDIGSQSLLKRFQVSHNLSLDRMHEQLNSKNMTEAGPRELLDETGELSDLEDRMDKTLPGVQTGDASLRSVKPEARTYQVRFSPTSRSWAAASTNGLLIYSVDDAVHFDPFDLDMDVTPDSVLSYLSQQDYTKSLLCAFRLGEVPLIDQVYLTIPASDIPLVIRDIGSKYFEKFLKMLLRQFDASPRLELHLEWTSQFFRLNTRFLKDRSLQYRPLLRALHKVMNGIQSDFSNL